MIESAVVLFAC